MDALLMSISMWSVMSLIFECSHILCLLLVTFAVVYVVPIQLGWTSQCIIKLG